MTPTKIRRRAYPTIQAWMADTGTNQTELARRAGCKQAHLSSVLSKSRRCSVALAWKLSEITNVPIEAITEWPPKYRENADV